jgi:hypothetical protein
MATSFYVVQRTSRARLWGGNLAWFVFWGYQLFIVMAATGYLLGIHPGQGIRRARMVRRPVADDRLGRLPGRVPGHAPQAQGAAHLRGQLVLPGLHRHHRDAAHRQQPGDPGLVRLQELQAFSGRAGRDDAVVVRPQRGGLLPDRRLPGHDVLLRAQAGRAPGLLLPAVDHPLLGADLPVHLGRSAPPALHRAARLGLRRWAWCSRSCCGCPPGAA